MSEMLLPETVERFNESMKRAISRARELGIAQKNTDWDKVALSLAQLHANGQRLIASKQIGRQDALDMLVRREGLLKAQLN